MDQRRRASAKLCYPVVLYDMSIAIKQCKRRPGVHLRSASPQRRITNYFYQFNAEAEAKDCYALIQVGSFYELYWKAAEDLAPIAGLALTCKTLKDDGDRPAAGFPLSQLDRHIGTLVRQNKKRVALFEEFAPHRVENTKTRRMTRIYTPGTLIDEVFVSDTASNYICLIVGQGDDFGLCWTDLSTGELFQQEAASLSDVRDILERSNPSEVVLPIEDSVSPVVQVLQSHDCTVYPWRFPKAEIPLSPRDYLQAYVDECLPWHNVRLGKPAQDLKNGLRIDATSLKSLNILKNSTGGTTGTLLQVVNATQTLGGLRFLKHRLQTPLNSIPLMNAQYDIIGYLMEQRGLRQELRSILQGYTDVTRCLVRLERAYTFKDVFSVGLGLAKAAEVADVFQQHALHLPDASPVLNRLTSKFQDCMAPLKELTNSIRNFEERQDSAAEEEANDEPDAAEEKDEALSAFSIAGSIKLKFHIRPSFSPSLQEAHDAYNESLRQFEQMKCTFQGMGGDRVTLAYDKRSQTPVVRWPITKRAGKPIEGPVLKSLKSYTLIKHQPWIDLYHTLHSSAQHISEIEKIELERVVKSIHRDFDALEKMVQEISELDFSMAGALLADQYNYVRPVVDMSHDIELVNGRHPTLEQRNSNFQPITITLTNGTRFVVLTGPNMAGKSTCMRLICELSILAHIGFFVPADYFRIGLVDQILTRIGAQDNVARGSSTFMVETTESGYILINATSRSLVLLDEIGRGTSPRDGTAVGYATAKMLQKKQARTIFATHLHTVCDMLKGEEGVVFKHTSVHPDPQSESGFRFDYSLQDGINRNSEALITARMAKLPDEFIQLAEDALKQLDDKGELIAPSQGQEQKA